jgi:hypothetical protein
LPPDPLVGRLALAVGKSVTAGETLLGKSVAVGKNVAGGKNVLDGKNVATGKNVIDGKNVATGKNVIDGRQNVAGGKNVLDRMASNRSFAVATWSTHQCVVSVMRSSAQQRICQACRSQRKAAGVSAHQVPGKMG